MTPLLPNDFGFAEEEKLRTDVRIAIERALTDVLEQDEQRKITHIEEEKLTHFAIRDLNLPLTYSWYLAGGHTIAEAKPEARPSWQPGQAFGDLKAQECQYSEKIKEFRAYFRSEEFFPGYTLRDVWFTNKFEFLRDYYRELAPEKYRELYLHSLDLRERLWNLNEILRRESKNASLSDFGATHSNPLLDPSSEEDMRYLISDLHMDLAGIEELSPIKKEVTRGTDVLEQIFSKLTHLETINIEQSMFIEKDVHDFFYYYIWKYPSLAISVDEAKGPNAADLKHKRLLEFDKFDETLRTEVASITQQARGIDLFPGLDEPVSDGSQKSTYYHTILKESMDIR